MLARYLRRVQLEGLWRAHGADDDLRRSFADNDFDDSDWTELTVPGHWRSSTQFADQDQPVFHRTNFETERSDDQTRHWLTFDGIFYDSDVFLDGAYLGETSGYFFPHSFEITERVADRDQHQLAVEVSCRPQLDRQQKRNLTGAFQHSSSLNPAWNPGGIWRPVHYVTTGPVAIRFFRVICTRATKASATLAIRAVVHTETGREVTFRTVVAGTEHEEIQPLAAGENRVEWTVDISNPERWWPHSLGEPHLHEVEVEVLLDDNFVSDERSVTTGFRSVSLNNWITSINDERLFLKGANLGPTRQAIADATDDEIIGDLNAAREAGLDFLRVHTHVARPELYRAADELGLLLWQDFPMHQGYDRAVRGQAVRQAREMVDLLGHHPSVFLWCGHNEPDGRDTATAAPSLVRTNRPGWNRTVLDRTIRRVLTKNDPSRPVIAHSGVPPHLPLLDGTDSHLWFGWHGPSHATGLADFAARLPRQVRFVSEFGAQSVPVDSEFCQPERWPSLDWKRLSEHHGLEHEVLVRRVPPSMFETFEEWAEATRSYQAHVVKVQVEALRRLKYTPTGGFSLHLLADGQPAISSSVLGHDRRPKPAFQALVDACRPIIVTADPLPNNPLPGETALLGVHVISDLRDSAGVAVVKATLRDPVDTYEWRWEGAIEADTVTRVGEVVWTIPRVGGEVTLDLELTGPDLMVTNRYATTL
ncbi:MAG: sugar-binding domain-containing protein [Acidimicrobiales bacterium]